MEDKDLRIHNIALLYNLLKELHPDEHIELSEIAANYDGTINELKELFE